EELNFELNIISRSNSPVTVQKIAVLSEEKKLNNALPYDSAMSFNYTVKIPDNIEPSQPYWLKLPVKSASQYDVQTDSLIGLPYAPASLKAKLSVEIEGETIEIEAPFSYKNLDPIKGDVVEPLRIVPAVNIEFTQPIYFQKGDSSLKLGVNIYSNHNVK